MCTVNITTTSQRYRNYFSSVRESSESATSLPAKEGESTSTSASSAVGDESFGTPDGTTSLSLA